MSVEKYSFKRQIEDGWYACEIPAESFEEAELIMQMLDGRDLGKVIEQHPVCNGCFGELICLNCEDLADGFLPPEIPCYQN